jgi:hypothetical protein
MDVVLTEDQRFSRWPASSLDEAASIGGGRINDSLTDPITIHPVTEGGDVSSSKGENTNRIDELKQKWEHSHIGICECSL